MCTETFLTFTCVQRGIPVCASSGDHDLPNTLYFLRITYTTHARGRYNSDAASLKMSRSRCLQLLRRCMNTDNIIRKHAPPLHDATRGVQAHREPLLFTTLLYNIQPVPCGEPPGIGSPPWTVPSADGTHGPRTTPLAIPVPGWVGGSTRSRSPVESAAEDPIAQRIRRLQVPCACCMLPCCACKQSCNVQCNCCAALQRDETLPCNWSGTEHSIHHGHMMVQHGFVSRAVTHADACVNAGCADEFALPISMHASIDDGLLKLGACASTERGSRCKTATCSLSLSPTTRVRTPRPLPCQSWESTVSQ